MFVEKLTKDEIKELIYSLNIGNYAVESIDYIGVYDINRWWVELKNNDGIGKSIFVSDFEIQAKGLYMDKNIFKSFMYKKFGEEYKQAFNDQLKRKFEEELIK